jgi:protein TonB
MIEVAPPKPAALVPLERVKDAPKPVPPTTKPLIQRAPEPAAPPPALAAAPRAEPAPTTFPVQTQAPALPTKAVEPPVAVAAPTPAPALAPVTAARFDADYLRNPAPTYPPMSRKFHEEGKVLLQVNVTATGMAEQVQIKQGSGYSRLDEAALNTVRQWRFTPARRGDEAVAASVVVPIVFRLEE